MLVQEYLKKWRIFKRVKPKNDMMYHVFKLRDASGDYNKTIFGRQPIYLHMKSILSIFCAVPALTETNDDSAKWHIEISN